MTYQKRNFKTIIVKTKIFILLLLITSYCADANAQAPFQVVVKGKGYPVLLIPGFGCIGEVWNETVSALAETHECLKV